MAHNVGDKNVAERFSYLALYESWPKTSASLRIFLQNWPLPFFHYYCAAISTTAELLVFTALHEMQTRSSDENSVCLSVCLSVCPSVCLSVTRVIPDKIEERSVHIFIPYETTFSLVLWEEEWLVAGDPFYVKFWVNRPPLKRNRRFSTNNRS